MSLEITHLVVNGCSFTYGQGLEDRENNNWPSLIAKKLNVPVINLAVPGAGCDRIFRTTYEYFHKNKNHIKPFYIIAWTESSRREEFLADKNDYKNINLSDPTSALSKEFIMNMTTEGIINYERKKMIYWASIISLFREHNTPYLMTDAMKNTIYSPEKIRSFNPDIYDYIYNDTNKIKDLFDIRVNLPKLPCGHDGLETQHIFADYVYNEVKSRYNITNVQS